MDTTVPDTSSPQHVVQVRLEPRVRHWEIAMFIKGNSLSATPFIGTQVYTYVRIFKAGPGSGRVSTARLGVLEVTAEFMRLCWKRRHACFSGLCLLSIGILICLITTRKSCKSHREHTTNSLCLVSVDGLNSAFHADCLMPVCACHAICGVTKL